MPFPEKLPILSTNLGLATQYFDDVDTKNAFNFAGDFGVNLKLDNLGLGDEVSKHFTFKLLVDFSLGEGVGASEAFAKQFSLMNPNGLAWRGNYFGLSDLTAGYNNQNEAGHGFKIDLGYFVLGDPVTMTRTGYDELGGFLNVSAELPTALAYPLNPGVGLAMQQRWSHLSVAGGFNVDVFSDSQEGFTWARLGLHLFSGSSGEHNTAFILAKTTSVGPVDGLEEGFRKDQGSWNIAVSTDQNLGKNLILGLEYAHHFGDLGDHANSFTSRLLLSGKIFGRSDDTIGLAHAWSNFEAKGEKAVGEHGIEFFYRIQLGPVALSPDLQLLIADNDNVFFVPGARILASW